MDNTNTTGPRVTGLGGVFYVVSGPGSDPRMVSRNARDRWPLWPAIRLGRRTLRQPLFADQPFCR